MIRCILLCHDAFIMGDTISGSSQDDIVLIDAIHKSGMGRLLFKDLDTTKIEVNGSTEEYQFLKKLEFTSYRKMMSVVCMNTHTKQINIYSKGADCAISDKLLDKSSAKQQVQQADQLSNEGYRTLCYAMKFMQTFTADESSRSLEKDLIALGVSAVEDLLQADVSKSITDFHESGIKVWMLTGDKAQNSI